MSLVFLFLFVFVSLVSPVNGIFLSIPSLCRTENLPKLFSFMVNPVRPPLLLSVRSLQVITVLTMCPASFLTGKFTCNLRSRGTNFHFISLNFHHLRTPPSGRPGPTRAI